MTGLDTALFAVQIILAIVITTAGVTKLAAVEAQVETFQRLGYAPWVRGLVGGLELIAGLSLLVGLELGSLLTVLGSVTIVFLLSGATYSHIRAEDGFQQAAIPASLALISFALILSNVF